MFLVLAVAGLVAGLVVRANSTSQLTCNGLLETCLRNHPLPPATPNTLVFRRRNDYTFTPPSAFCDWCNLG
jgi:hypothetical protein